MVHAPQVGRNLPVSEEWRNLRVHTFDHKAFNFQWKTSLANMKDLKFSILGNSSAFVLRKKSGSLFGILI